MFLLGEISDAFGRGKWNRKSGDPRGVSTHRKQWPGESVDARLRTLRRLVVHERIDWKLG
jgi:hypothetical protein